LTAMGRRVASVAGLWNGASRAGLVVFGGLLALQSSDQLSPIKILYLVVASVAVVGSVASVWMHRNDRSISVAFPWILMSIILLALVAVSLPVAIAHGTPLSSWVRDASAYGLIAASPWLALDLGRTTGRQSILVVLLVAGGLGVAAFVVDWVRRRGLGDLPIDRLALSSFALAAATYCVACGLSVARPRRWPWIVLATLILVALLLTGTRSSVVLLGAPVALLLAAIRSDRAHVASIGVTTVVQVVAVAAVLVMSLRQNLVPGPIAATPSSSPGILSSAPPTSASFAASTASPTLAVLPTASPAGASPEPDILAKRFGTVADLLSGRDASFRERIEQTLIAWDAFASSPIVGVGLGYDFARPNTDGEPQHQFTLDTPILALAKFGILALLLLVTVAAAFWATIRYFVRKERWSWITQSIIAYAVLLVVMLPLGWPPEDKGMGLALILLLGAAFGRGDTAEVHPDVMTPTSLTVPTSHS
jgi:hypothetical protein